MTPAERDGGLEIRATLPSVAASLPGFLPAQRWFGGKERAVERVEIRDTAVIPEHPSSLLAVVDVFSSDASVATYFLPLGLDDPALAAVSGEIVARHGDLVVRDAIGDPETCRALLRGMLNGQTLSTTLGGRFIFQPTQSRQTSDSGADDAVDLESLAVRHAGVEQSNSSVIFGTTYILKALRRLAAGTNPEIEIPRFLGEHTTFDRVPALVGWAEYRAPDGSSAPVAVLQRFVRNEGDGWSYVLRRVSEEVLASQTPRRASPEAPYPHGSAAGAGEQGPGEQGAGLAGEVARLGRTLAALHLALASCPDLPAFAPEPIGQQDIDQWRRRTHANLDEILLRVAHRLQSGPAGTGWSASDRHLGGLVCGGADRLRAAIDGIAVLADGVTVKTRHHGDFHLGQTLVAPYGWIIIDFEGEPLRSLDERRAKQTPLRDLAGLLRSLDYAQATVERQANTGGASLAEGHKDRASAAGAVAPEGALVDLFARCREALLQAYVETVRAGDAPLLPASSEDLHRVLLALETEKALYELTYELGNRPDWVSIPLSALARLAQAP